MNSSLLKLQIGPVQDFIAQARSTRDLWSGSYLLSWLMAAGARALVKKCGNDPQVVISPVLAGQPIYDFQTNPARARTAHHNDAMLALTAPARRPIGFRSPAPQARSISHVPGRPSSRPCSQSLAF